MFYRVRLTRRETGMVWFSPYYFRSHKRALKEATFWDKYFGKKPFQLSFIGEMQPVWSAELIEYSKKPEGVFMRATEPRKKAKSKKESDKSEELKRVLEGEA